MNVGVVRPTGAPLSGQSPFSSPAPSLSKLPCMALSVTYHNACFCNSSLNLEDSNVYWFG